MGWKTYSLFPFIIVIFMPSSLLMVFISMVQVNKNGGVIKPINAKIFQDPLADGDILFDGFDNYTGAPFPIIPNLVHFVLFGRNSLDFTTFLCMMAALKIQRPHRLFLHTDAENGTFTGHYWEQLLMTATKMVPINITGNKMYPPKVKLISRSRPTHVYGQRLSSVWHAADVARLDLLKKYGGMTLDGDALILRPFTPFRHFEMAIGWPENGYIGSQVIVAHPKARLLRLWLESYRVYRPRLWYYNAGQLPTQQILFHHPSLVHRVPVLFGVHNLAEQLYSSSKDVAEKSWWRKEGFYSIHLLSRHRNYLAHSNINSGALIDEQSVLKDNTYFGQMARWILYDIEPTLPLPSRDSNG
ncbi:uncharacterized protein [Hetaerina americana]|uniref:uncharacterized protein n=1 Tax=Hetaerina americana TaxID=62018 RepID=UPI003A7F5C80